ncbi:MAG TPA: class I SAM-dependent methyltransferase [Bryobacteraceae bacterium]|nr:class I SAM-dependent methyltransferase [Bryobacteraceae bacterium]
MVTAEADAPTIKSFRDPAGAVFRHQGRILRAVQPAFVPQLESFLATPMAREAMASGRMAGTVRLSGAESSGLGLEPEIVFEHERIPFASYPYEWPAEMLQAAGVLTLDLAAAALEAGFGIKDATPYNVLFRGSGAVFVDVLSFERRNPSDATWMAYAQFVRTFLVPLAAHKYLGMAPGDVLAAHRDGLEPETVYRWTGWWRRLTPPLLGLVSLPVWLGRRESEAVYRPKPAASSEQARFILQGLLRSCRRQLNALAPLAGEQSVWTDYLGHKSLYGPQQLAQKEDFVREALELGGSRRVLDVGANEGHFSFLAARAGASVVAIDSDPTVVGSIWRAARRERGAEPLDVLPLVVDLARPTAATGWRNQECESFLERACGGSDGAGGQFDLVLMLAVLHHLLVSDRIPLEDVLALAADLTRGYAVIEFVAPEDPMFQRIVRGREQLHADLTVERFEQAARTRFDVVRSRKIDGLNRWLYLLRRRG